VVLDPLDGLVKRQVVVNMTGEEEEGEEGQRTGAVNTNQNSIGPERRNCAGFEENIVLGKGEDVKITPMQIYIFADFFYAMRNL
jgi:hypothetical protein